jgi:hypothetical protein
MKKCCKSKLLLVVTVTRYGLDGPGFGTPFELNILHFRTGPEAQTLPGKWVPGLYAGDKVRETWN